MLDVYIKISSMIYKSSKSKSNKNTHGFGMKTVVNSLLQHHQVFVSTPHIRHMISKEPVVGANMALYADVVEAARLWLYTHPDAGPGYDRVHDLAVKGLMEKIRVLNRADMEPWKPKS